MKVASIALIAGLLTAPGTAVATPAEGGTFKPHVLGVFLGATDEDGGSTEFTYGLEYGYKFTPRIGVGAFYEDSPDGHGGDGITVAVGSLLFIPHSNWRLGVGVGQEKVGGSHGHTDTLYRLGVAYHFHVGNFGIAPVFNIDRVDGNNALVFGLSFSRGFGAK